MTHQAETHSRTLRGISWETGAALAGTGFIAFLVFLLTLNAGPLWRDETNTINIAQMPKLSELWNNMPFESFPALWILVLRGYSLLGLAASDAGIRLLGFFVGLGFLGSLWFAARCFGARGPILSLALLGGLPFFYFTVTSNRAYGLAMCLLVLSVGTLWRVVQSPTRARIFSAGVVTTLFLHCVYYDAVFQCSMLFGAALVLARRHHWKALGALALVNALAASTLVIYLPILSKASTYAPMIRVSFTLSSLWDKLAEAVTACSGPEPGGPTRPGVWMWVLLVALGVAAALVAQIRSSGSTQSSTSANQTPASASVAQQGADLALFSLSSLLFGTGAYYGFLFKLQFPTEPWYYFGLLSLCGICLDGLLTANWPAPRPWGLLRIAFMAVLLILGGKAIWQEAHTRRSNVDLIAEVLSRKAEQADLILVQGAWEGLTWDRYYHGPSRWATVPSLGSHKVHRTDLMWKMMDEPDPMGPLLGEISSTLRNGKTVWVVGHLAAADPSQPASPPMPKRMAAKRWLGEFMWNWITDLTAHLSRRAADMKIIATSVDGPVNRFENLPLTRFSGYRPARDEENRPPGADLTRP